jgi:hypothetical protein
MIKKTDTAAKRLAELFTESPKLSAALKKQEEEKGPGAKVGIPDWNEVLPDWVDPILTIFSLNPSVALDQAIITAFNKAGLDPKQLSHWRALISLFAYAHFGRWPSSGRPKEWTSETYSDLLCDFLAITNKNPNISVSRACDLLTQRYPEKYKQSKGRLAKEVMKAKDPKFHPALAHFLNLMLVLARVEYERKDLVWSQEIEARKRKEYLELALKHLGMKKSQKTNIPSASN